MKEEWDYYYGSQFDFVEYCKENYGLDLNNELKAYENHIKELNVESKKAWVIRHEKDF